MKKILVTFLFSLCAFSASAYEPDAYKKAIPFYNYVEDIEALLTSGISRNGWTLSEEDGVFYANLSHKKYILKVELNTQNNEIKMNLISAFREGCGSKTCKVDNDKVQGWLIRLRRVLALEVTMAVKKHAVKAYALSS